MVTLPQTEEEIVFVFGAVVVVVQAVVVCAKKGCEIVMERLRQQLSDLEVCVSVKGEMG
jgi:hypothetical protein